MLRIWKRQWINNISLEIAAEHQRTMDLEYMLAEVQRQKEEDLAEAENRFRSIRKCLIEAETRLETEEEERLTELKTQHQQMMTTISGLEAKVAVQRANDEERELLQLELTTEKQRYSRANLDFRKAYGMTYDWSEADRSCQQLGQLPPVLTPVMMMSTSQKSSCVTTDDLLCLEPDTQVRLESTLQALSFAVSSPRRPSNPPSMVKDMNIVVTADKEQSLLSSTAQETSMDTTIGSGDVLSTPPHPAGIPETPMSAQMSSPDISLMDLDERSADAATATELPMDDSSPEVADLLPVDTTKEVYSRSPPRQRSPPRESARRAEAETSHSSASYPAPTSTASRSEPTPSVPTALKRDLVLEPEPPRVEWIPGLDIQPEPIHTPVVSLPTTTIHKEPEVVRREEPRAKPAESSYTQPSSSHSRDPYPTSSHEHSVSSSTRHQSDHSRGRERSRSPQYSQSRSHAVESSRSPVGRRHEAERDYNWVHPKTETSRSGIAVDTVRVSVNLPASPGDVDLRRDRSSTAPWERKRQEQEQRSQREAEEQRERERQLAAAAAAAELDRHNREAEQRARIEPTVKMADTHHYFPPSSASTVASRGSLSSRFGAGTDSELPFLPKENITVGIQRNLKGGDDRIPVKRHFVESEVVVPRGKEEGEKPLSLREEFMKREEEAVEERRIVKVVKSENDKSSSHREVKRENFEVRREHFTKPLSDRWKDNRVIEPSTTSHRRSDTHDKEKSSYRDDVRNVDSVRDERTVRHRSREDERKRSPARDERKVSDSSRKNIKDSSEYRDKSSFGNKRGRYEQDPTDLRHNLASKRRTSEKSEDPGRDRDIRSRIGERDMSRERRTGDRPDFSKRDDKYAYEEWKDRPEMIPKGSSYYEHDNRDTFVPRGRGRGFTPFRGRGGYVRGRGRGFTPFRGRGGFRGRGRGYTRGFTNYYNKRSSADGDREWKHDKFKEIEDNKDERPTSTTEK